MEGDFAVMKRGRYGVVIAYPGRGLFTVRWEDGGVTNERESDLQKVQRV